MKDDTKPEAADIRQKKLRSRTRFRCRSESGVP